MKKILVIGGLHGNESLGIEIVQALQQNPVPGVTALIGNPEAVKQNQRFVKNDLNRIFPGNQNGTLEERRAADLMQKAAEFDLVLDFHNTTTPSNDCVFVGENSRALLPIAATLGLSRAVIATYDCINKFVPTCISIEISTSSSLYDSAHWIAAVTRLAQETTKETKEAIELFSFVRRITSAEQTKYQFKEWRAFQPLSQNDRQRLALPEGTYCPIFVNDSYTPYNFAGVVQKI